jgi:hypothetical protein
VVEAGEQQEAAIDASRAPAFDADLSAGNPLQ